MLQQRIELLRSRSWTEIATGPGLVRVMAAATDSEKELLPHDARETLAVSPVLPSEVGPTAGPQPLKVTRQQQSAKLEFESDLTAEPMLMFTATVSWVDPRGPRERSIRSIICRAGLTRNGIVGSRLGRPEPAAATTP